MGKTPEVSWLGETLGRGKLLSMLRTTIIHYYLLQIIYFFIMIGYGFTG